MTKEMRPSHRIDVLSSALLFYGLRTIRKLGKCCLRLSSVIQIINRSCFFTILIYLKLRLVNLFIFYKEGNVVIITKVTLSHE